MKEELKMHTLAIGDGANDVSMIQVPDQNRFKLDQNRLKPVKTG